MAKKIYIKIYSTHNEKKYMLLLKDYQNFEK